MLGSNDFKDFEKNEILFAESNGTNYIFQLNRIKGYGKTFTASSSGVNGNDYSQVRQATPLEKAWLQECIKQEKFVPLDKIKVNNYRLWKLKVNC